jgi:hypothetical protein
MCSDDIPICGSGKNNNRKGKIEEGWIGDKGLK